MGKRKKGVMKRLPLIRQCGTCGKTFSTTAASPFIRQLPRDGKAQATTYFCSEKCYKASFKHIGWYDGLAWKRRQEREAARDNTERNRAYKAAHRKEINAKRMERYWANRSEEMADSAFYRKKRKTIGNTADA